MQSDLEEGAGAGLVKRLNNLGKEDVVAQRQEPSVCHVQCGDR